MKKIIIFLLCLLIVFNMFSQEKKEKKEKKVYHIASLYVAEETALVIAETDLLCSYFISKGINEDLRVNGAALMDSGQIAYADGDDVFINAGSQHGFKEGDVFLFIAKGEKIYNPVRRGKLGTYYAKKGLGKLTCLYEDKAVVTISKACNPIEVGDIVQPFKEEPVIRKKKIDYKRCRLPESAVLGNVVYSNVFPGIKRNVSGFGDYVSIDLGKAYVSRGDYVLFYKVLKPSLPPVIIGSGIVLNPEHNNATVLVLDTSEIIEIGARLVLLPEEEERVVAKEEKVPIVEPEEEAGEEPGEETLEVDVLFDLGEKTIAEEQYQQEFDRIAQFIEPKSSFIIVLRGYTCSIGGFEYNLKLSQERVEFIKELLMKRLDIEEKFFDTNFYGEKDSPFDNTTEEQRRKNRLVNIQVIGR